MVSAVLVRDQQLPGVRTRQPLQDHLPRRTGRTRPHPGPRACRIGRCMPAWSAGRGLSPPTSTVPGRRRPRTGRGPTAASGRPPPGCVRRVGSVSTATTRPPGVLVDQGRPGGLADDLAAVLHAAGVAGAQQHPAQLGLPPRSAGRGAAAAPVQLARRWRSGSPRPGPAGTPQRTQAASARGSRSRRRPRTRRGGGRLSSGHRWPPGGGRRCWRSIMVLDLVAGDRAELPGDHPPSRRGQVDRAGLDGLGRHAAGLADRDVRPRARPGGGAAGRCASR